MCEVTTMAKMFKWIGVILILSISVYYGIKAVDAQKYTYKVIESGYVSDFESIVLDSFEEYENFIDYKVEDTSMNYKDKIKKDKYNKDFFKNNSLALAFKPCHPSDVVAAVNLLHTGNHLNIMTTIQYAEAESMTDEISGFIVLVEVGKDVEEVSIY